MANIIAELVSWINDNVENYAFVYVDTLTDESESICVRTEPGNAIDNRDMSGARYGDYQFAIYCKTEDTEKAIAQLTEYQERLDLEQYPISGRTNITCETLTEPHYISKSDNGEKIYSASFHLEYYQGA